MAKESGIEGLFILISKLEKKIQVLVSRRYLGETMKQQRDVIRTSFTAGFRHGNFDEGLKHGVATIGESLLRAQRAGELSGKTRAGSAAEWGIPSGKAAGPLVLRNQVRLTLSGAQVVIAAAKEKAQSLKLKVNVAVVDDGGHLIAFERMDGARPASAYTAITKATSAATFRQASGPLGSGGASPDPLLNLSLQNAASASGGKITTLFGGIPVVVDEQVIGAVGVGGGTGEQDAQIGTAGIAALLEQLGSCGKKGTEGRRETQMKLPDMSAGSISDFPSRVDLRAVPTAGLDAAIDPAVLWVTVQLEHVDFVRIKNQQAEMREGSFLVGMNGWKRDVPIARLAGAGQVKLTRTGSASSRHDVASRLEKAGVLGVVPDHCRRAADSKLLVGRPGSTSRAQTKERAPARRPWRFARR